MVGVNVNVLEILRYAQNDTLIGNLFRYAQINLCLFTGDNNLLVCQFKRRNPHIIQNRQYILHLLHSFHVEIDAFFQ